MAYVANLNQTQVVETCNDAMTIRANIQREHTHGTENAHNNMKLTTNGTPATKARRERSLAGRSGAGAAKGSRNEG